MLGIVVVTVDIWRRRRRRRHRPIPVQAVGVPAQLQSLSMASLRVTCCRRHRGGRRADEVDSLLGSLSSRLRHRRVEGGVVAAVIERRRRQHRRFYVCRGGVPAQLQSLSMASLRVVLSPSSQGRRRWR